MLPKNILVFVTKEIVNWTTIMAIKTPYNIYTASSKTSQQPT